MRKSVSKSNLTIERACLFARRARAYILAYHALHTMSESEEAPVISLAIIERVQKAHKCHRCVADIDKAFLNAVHKNVMDHNFL